MMVSAITPKKQRRKRCSECGELKDDVQGKQRLCEECEQDKDYCQICDEWADRAYGGCRHVGWVNDPGCCCGCGTTDITAEDHKESFCELLERLAPLKVYDSDDPLLPRLLAQIEANNFWTFWHGPMIGGPSDLDLRYEVPGRDGWCTWFAQIPAEVQLDWGDEAIEAMQLGMGWLTSLDHRSMEANAITALWIREFLAA